MEISWWFTWKHKTVCDISTRGIKDNPKNTTKKTHELTSNHQEADTRILLHIQYAFHMKRSLLVLLIQMFFWLYFPWYLIWISNCTCWLELVVKDVSSIWMQLVMIFLITKIKQTTPKMISWNLWFLWVPLFHRLWYT